MARRLHLTFDVEHNPGMGLFQQEVLRRNLSHLASDKWPTSAELETEDAIWTSVAPEGSFAMLELRGGALAFVHVGFGNAFAQVAGPSEEAAWAGLEAVRTRLPRASRERAGRVPVRFWSYGPHGPMPMGRTLSVPSWQEIAPNYPVETAAGLARLMSGNLPWRGGQLILWHGETGTGKTTALRALAREWSSWCEPNYITDPETFFGHRSDYMLSVMLESQAFSEDEDEDGGVTGHRPLWSGGIWGLRHLAMAVHGRSAGEKRETASSWRLLILEDTGELLAADARMQAGQGLSRFLNVVDGLIGQGLRILVLVTTNEEIGRLHPAVARPGRCAANVLFTQIPPQQANAWLAERNHDATVSEPLTLASLYAIVEGWDAVVERQATGFA
jgi:hypothetical protein